MYLYDRERSGYNGNITSPNVGNVSSLTMSWSRQFPSAFDGSLIIVNGTVYAGSEGGYLYAMNASTGHPLSASAWKTPFLGNSSSPSYSHCGTTMHPGARHDGITATSTFTRSKIWENGGYPTFYEISQNGTILNRTDVGNSSTNTPWYYDYLWTSPLLSEDKAYIGTAALCEYNNGDTNPHHWKYVQSQLLKINLSSDKITHIFNVTTGGSPTGTNVGGSIWSTPMVDLATDTIWITTGNANCTDLPCTTSTETPGNGEYPQSIVALNSTNLHLRAGCQVEPASTWSQDLDFGAGPTLFNDSHGNRYVGAVNKDGTFYAVNATDFNATNSAGCNGGALKIAWKVSGLGYSGSGDISPAAFDGTRLYLTYGASGSTTNGYVDALSPSNGALLWAHPFSMKIGTTSYYAYGGVSCAAGIVYVDATNAAGTNGGALFALYASNGTLAYSHAFNETIAGPPAIAEGMVFVATGSALMTGMGYVDAFAP